MMVAFACRLCYTRYGVTCRCITLDRPVLQEVKQHTYSLISDGPVRISPHRPYRGGGRNRTGVSRIASPRAWTTRLHPQKINRAQEYFGSGLFLQSPYSHSPGCIISALRLRSISRERRANQDPPAFTGVFYGCPNPKANRGRNSTKNVILRIGAESRPTTAWPPVAMPRSTVVSTLGVVGNGQEGATDGRGFRQPVVYLGASGLGVEVHRPMVESSRD